MNKKTHNKKTQTINLEQDKDETRPAARQEGGEMDRGGWKGSEEEKGKGAVQMLLYKY